MSKNFELMQQASIGIRQEPAILGASWTDRFEAHRDFGNFDDDKASREESLKLIQRIFVGQGASRTRMVVFAGIDGDPECSRICARTARVLADNVAGSVCLVDANLRSPLLAAILDVSNYKGLMDSLIDGAPIRSFVRQVGPENLWLLPCGSLASESRTLLNSDRLNARLAELNEQFDHVLIVGPALSQYAEAAALGKMTDGLVVILEANTTRRGSALKAIEMLRGAQVELLGAVLNNRTFPIPEFVYRRL
jgi:Mrp family chromosome partitioning ATPase